ncbi:MAG: hypothetical protein HY965_02085 [Ignavibacteriales bacterium]|nr:hypothetical protein [Ignavibacteriales bacterium]
MAKAESCPYCKYQFSGQRYEQGILPLPKRLFISPIMYIVLVVSLFGILWVPILFSVYSTNSIPPEKLSSFGSTLQQHLASNPYVTSNLNINKCLYNSGVQHFSVEYSYTASNSFGYNASISAVAIFDSSSNLIGNTVVKRDVK